MDNKLKVSIVAALADDYAIGYKGKLPWNLPADMKHFKALTTGGTVIMGKRTFESLPNGPLPNRTNIVLSSMISEGVNEGYFEANSLEDALELCSNAKEVFVIGGSAVYKQSADIADTMYLPGCMENSKQTLIFLRLISMFGRKYHARIIPQMRRMSILTVLWCMKELSE